MAVGIFLIYSACGIDSITTVTPGLAASNSIPDYVKPENFKAMIEATKKYGKYPINIE